MSAMSQSLELKIPPVIQVIATAAVMWGTAKLFPGMRLVDTAPRALVIAIGLLGFSIAVSGILSFARAKTTVDPTTPEKASELVHFGIYRVTRNPMYLGFLLILTAMAVRLLNPLNVVWLVAFVVYMTRFQIVPEERALQSQFGERYTQYRRQVRRWI